MSVSVRVYECMKEEIEPILACIQEGFRMRSIHTIYTIHTIHIPVIRSFLLKVFITIVSFPSFAFEMGGVA